MSMDSEEIEKKFSKFFRFLGVVTDLQIDFLNDSKLFQTFEDWILIELAKGFNLRRMRVLRSHKLKNYYVITKFLLQNRKFWGEKYFFLDFVNMLWEHFLKFFHLH